MAPSSTTRERLAVALVVVAALSLVAAVTTLWARSHPLDSVRFAAATERALEHPEVVGAVARTATDQLVDLALAVADPRQLLPGPLRNIGSGAENWVRELLAGPMERILRTEPGRQVLVAAVREAHGEVVSALQDGRSARGTVRVDADVVRLDLTGVLALGLDVLAQRGVLPGRLAGLGDTMRGGIDGTRDWLFDRTGVDIGEDLGTVVVYDGAAVGDSGLALRSARWFGPSRLPVLAWILLGAAAAAGALAVGTDRRRTTAVFGAALAAGAIGAHLYVRLVRRDIEHLIEDDGMRLAARSIMTTLDRPLVITLAVLAVVGVVAVLGARRDRGVFGARS